MVKPMSKILIFISLAVLFFLWLCLYLHWIFVLAKASFRANCTLDCVCPSGMHPSSNRLCRLAPLFPSGPMLFSLWEVPVNLLSLREHVENQLFLNRLVKNCISRRARGSCKRGPTCTFPLLTPYSLTAFDNCTQHSWTWFCWKTQAVLCCFLIESS